MSWLTPLYLAGAAAVILPVLFHLIRRSPQGRQSFSSLLFLTPSPPTLSRRSRLNNLLLLMLRSAVLALLAIAFARPFIRRTDATDEFSPLGSRIAVLLDVSASMRRGDLWERAKREVDQVVATATPRDALSLYLFDESTRCLVTFVDWRLAPPSERRALLTSRLARESPTWNATRLGDALIAVAEALDATDSAAATRGEASRQIVLVSDLQQGSQIESLQGYEWPDGVRLDCRVVGIASTTNATIELAASDVSSASDNARVLVSNAIDSSDDQFSIAWGSSSSGQVHEVTKLSVPPGQSRSIQTRRPTGDAADCLVLSGDAQDFDNQLFLLPEQPVTMRICYFGDDSQNDPQGMSYFLRRALDSPHGRTVDLESMRLDGVVAPEELRSAALVVVAGRLSSANCDSLRTYTESGGTALVILTDADAIETVRGLSPHLVESASEAANDGFGLIGAIAFDQPIFQRFADPRFGDFTKVRFWRHRKVRLADQAVAMSPLDGVSADEQANNSDQISSGDGIHLLASFDNGDPFLWRQPFGRGAIYVFTSSWRPIDSQLALSSKFVPLIDAFTPRADDRLSSSQFTVGDRAPIPSYFEHATISRPVVSTDARSRSPQALAPVEVVRLDAPGIWRLAVDGREHRFAVNLSNAESKTAPLTVEDLERRGVKVGARQPDINQYEAHRQMRATELENQQQIWKWVIVLAVGFSAAETLLAGVLYRRATATAAIGLNRE